MIRSMTRNEKGELRRRCQAAIAKVHAYYGKNKTGTDLAHALKCEPGKDFARHLSRFLNGETYGSWLLPLIEVAEL